MSTKTLNLSLPTGLLEQIDEIVAKGFVTRSDFLRTAAERYIKNEESFKEILKYGKTLNRDPELTEEKVAEDITRLRRKNAPWRTGSN